MHINSTQIAGLVAFLPTCFASVLAGRARRTGSRGRIEWTAVAMIYAVFAAEVVVKARWVIGDSVREWLKTDGLYSDRQPAQTAALLILVPIAAVIAIQLMRRTPTRAAGVVRAATTALISLFIAETISLHSVDAFLYHQEGPILCIGWLWLFCGWTTGAAAVFDYRRNNLRPGGRPTNR